MSADDGIEPGLELGRRELVLTPDWIEQYMGAIDARNPWYTDDSPFGGPIAPAAVLNYELQMFGGWVPPGAGARMLNVKQRWEFREPMRPGQRVVLSARVAERYLRRGRDHVAVEASVHDLEGRLLCRTLSTHAWPVDDDAAGEAR